MRTDWHRYNLKRKIADLPPVSSDDYNDKVLAAQATTQAAADQAAFAKDCTICGKVYYSENAFRNHISSQKHKLREASTKKSGSGTLSRTQSTTTQSSKDPEAEAEFEKVVAGIKATKIQDQVTRDSLPRRPVAPPPDADAPQEHPLSPAKLPANAVPLSRCLFCNYDSPSVKLSLDHMMKIHGMFLPEQTYLVDLPGLVAYLQAKVRQNHECLYCHRLRNTAEAIQTHMRDKSHCKIAFESEEEMLEVGQFYDFSSTYSDDEEEDSDVEDSDEEMADAKTTGGAKVGGAADGDDDGWETDSDFSSLDSEELTSVPNDDRTESYNRLKLSRHHSNTGPKSHKSADGYHSRAHDHNNAVFYDEHEMHLPSGRVAGHRKLRKYFRQNLHSYPTAAERMANAQQLLEEGDSEMPDADMDEDDQVNGNAPQHRKGNALIRRDEAGMLGVSDVQKRQVTAQAQKNKSAAERVQNRYQARVEKAANNQKHFRDPLLQ